jgi:hypothetical protein
MQEYFFVAVSARENLEICKRYAYAGFPDTINGVWAYSDIKIGDYVTFLYGARAHNLYQVTKKEAIVNAKDIPPWEPIYFRESRRMCYFPFRLHLELWREFKESLAKPEFMYVAENLLQRGGYWKTHFQADQTTLQNVSQMGKRSDGVAEPLEMPPYKIFIPRFVKAKKIELPGTYQLREVILQSIIRQYLLQPENLSDFLDKLGLKKLPPEKFEVLGEKALPKGYVDILVKEARPTGEVKQIIIEVKLDRAAKYDVEQLKHYVDEIGEECLAGVLISGHGPKRLKLEDRRIHLMSYEFEEIDLKVPHTFEELLSKISISKT